MSDHHRLVLVLGVVLPVALIGTTTATAEPISQQPHPVLAFRLAAPAPILAHSAGGSDDGGSNSADDEGGPRGGLTHFVHWVGHFHPAMTVFPIGMLLGAALAEFLLILTGNAWLSGASRWCVIVGAVGAAITAPLGWAFAAGHGGARLLEIHRWLGTAAGAGAVVILLLSEASHRSGKAGWRAAFRAVLFLAVPLVMATGYFGGAMVYGVHEYDWNPPRHHTDAVGAQTSSAASSGGGQAVTVVEMTDDDAFQPKAITIVAGATVRWHNGSKDEHTVTDDPHAAGDAKDVSMPSGAAAFNSGTIKPGGSFEQKFTVPGAYQYVCEPHEAMDMKGEVVVNPAPAQ